MTQLEAKTIRTKLHQLRKRLVLLDAGSVRAELKNEAYNLEDISPNTTEWVFRWEARMLIHSIFVDKIH